MVLLKSFEMENGGSRLAVVMDDDMDEVVDEDEDEEEEEEDDDNDDDDDEDEEEDEVGVGNKLF